jgi:Alpha/beta hydrolase
MDLGDIDEWNVGALRTITSELSAELNTVTQVADELDKVSQLPGWDSPAADAARGKIKSVRGNVLDDAAVLGAVEQLAEETAAAVSKLQSELAELRALVRAQDGHLSMSDTGEVSITGTPDEVKKLQQLADDIETRAKALIHQAQDIDNDCAEVFGHVINGDVRANGAGDAAGAFTSGEAQSGLSAPYPPTGPQTEPNDATAWWDALSEDEQRKVITEHPDWIGGRDGVPTPARSEVNKGFLDREIAATQADIAVSPTWREYLPRHPEMTLAQAQASYNAMMAPKQERLASAQAIKRSMSIEGDLSKGYDPDRYLMLFKPGDNEMNAAVAIGNPDEATHVSVSTPGMNTHATSMPDMAAEAVNLRAEATGQLRLDGQGDEKVSAIAWFGYDPPDVDPTVLGALSEDRANAGAMDLASFYRGINATNTNGSDVHLSAFGHSYGSLTTAQALNELGQTGVVDDAVFYGSPGLGYSNDDLTVGAHGVPVPAYITDESQLYLPDGHAFVMSAPGDPVSEEMTVMGIPLPAMADLGGHGPNPTSLPFERLATEGAPGREGATGHSEYPRLGGNGLLRTPGYNLALVASGLAHEKPELLIR